MGTTSVSLRMARRAPVNRLPWRAVRYVFPFSKLAHTGSYEVHLQTGENLGMIPRAVDQVFRVAEEMKSRGWEYQMEGQFLEIVRLSSLFSPTLFSAN
jgi:hypothetical protein